ncbi:MAG: hypothetical protein IKP48_10215 [Bacteroidaceae bacterium]|nr:hypothetical protein [Bacteroidaceae bacterium]
MRKLFYLTSVIVLTCSAIVFNQRKELTDLASANIEALADDIGLTQAIGCVVMDDALCVYKDHSLFNYTLYYEILQ